MTSSFQPNPLPDISAYNYAKTEPDLTSAVNTSIDRLTQDRRNFYQQQIELHNQNLKHQEKKLEALINLVPAGVEMIQYAKKHKEAEEYYGTMNLSGQGLNDIKKEFDTTQNKIKENDQATEDLLESTKYSKIFQEGAIAGGKDSLDERAEIQQYAFDLKHKFPALIKNNTIRYKGEDRALFSAETEEEFSDIWQHLMGGFIYGLYESGANPALVKGYLRPELVKQYLTLRAEWLTKSAEILEKKAYESRKLNLITAIKEEGGEGMLRWIKTYHPFHGDYSKGWKEAFEIAHAAISKDEGDEYSLTDHQVEELLDFATKWRGSTKEITLAEHRKKDAALLINELKKRRTQFMEAKIAWQASQADGWISNQLSNIPFNELTEEKAREIYSQFVNVFSPSIGWNQPVPDRLKKLLTQSEDTEENRFKLLEIQYDKRGFISEEDAYGITGAEYTDKINDMLSASKKHLTDDQLKDHKARIKGVVDEWVKEAFPGQDTKDIEGYKEKIQVAYQRANDEYIRARRSILKERPSIEDEALYEAARDAMKPNIPDFWKGESQTESVNYEKASLEFKTKLNNNPELTFINIPFNDVEREVLMENAKSLDLGLPLDTNFYRGSKLKYDGKTLTPEEFAKVRLASTGFTDKAGDPIPERLEVSDELQELLLKNPSPANTLRAIAASKDPNWAIKILNRPDLTMADLYGHLIYQSEQEHSLNSLDYSWVVPGIIDEELNNEYMESIGDFNIYSNPQYMLPAIATEQVNAKLGQTEPGEIDWNKLNRAADKVVGGLTFRDLRPLEEVEESMDETYSQFNKIVTDVVRTVGDVALTDPFDWVNDIDRDMLDNLLRSIPTGHDLRPLAEQIEASDKASQEGRILIANLINNLSTMIVGDDSNY